MISNTPQHLDEAISDFGIELAFFFVDTEFGGREQWKMAVQKVYALVNIGVTYHQLGELITFCARKQEKGELTLELLEEKLTLIHRLWHLPLLQLHLIPVERPVSGYIFLENDKKDAERKMENKLNKRRQLLLRLMLPLFPADVEKVFEAINRNYGRDIDTHKVGFNLVFSII